MFLSDSAINRALSGGSLRVSQRLGKPVQIQPSSVELHLGSEFKMFDVGREVIDPLEEQAMQTFRCGTENPWFILQPQAFALGHTMEAVGVDSTLAAQVDGKSSLARLGLQVHMTSGFIDPGFHGHITLEFFNAAPKPIKLRPGMVIAQLFVIPIQGKVVRPYGSEGIDSRYQGQTGATPSRYGAGREGDTELPGMWEHADFTGGADEVRPPRAKGCGSDCIKSYPHSGPCVPPARGEAPLTQVELATLPKEEIQRRLNANGGKVYASGWPLVGLEAHNPDSEARTSDHHPGRGGW